MRRRPYLPALGSIFMCTGGGSGCQVVPEPSRLIGQLPRVPFICIHFIPAMPAIPVMWSEPFWDAAFAPDGDRVREALTGCPLGSWILRSSLYSPFIGMIAETS